MHYAKGVEDLEGTLDPDPLGVEEVDEDLPGDLPDLGADEVDFDEVLEDEDDVQVPDSYKAIFDELFDGPRGARAWDAHVKKVMSKVHEVPSTSNP